MKKKTLSMDSLISPMKMRKVLAAMLCVLIFGSVLALAVPITVYGQGVAKGTIYVDTSGIDTWASGPPPLPAPLDAQQLADLKNKILLEIKRNFESVVGVGNVSVTDNQTQAQGALKTVLIGNTLDPDRQNPDPAKRIAGYGRAPLNGNTAEVYLREFVDPPTDAAFKTGGNWDVTKLANAIAHTCSHELGHLFGYRHNNNTGDQVNKMTTNEGTDTDPNTPKPDPRYTAVDKATRVWTYDEDTKKAIRDGWPKLPRTRAKSPDTRDGYQGGGYLGPHYYYPWVTPPVQEEKPEEVGGVDVLFNFNGLLASQFYFGFLGPDSDGGLEDGNPQFDYIYQNSMEGSMEGGMLTFFGGIHDYLQFLLVGAPGSSYENQWFMLGEENLHLYDFVTQPDGDYVARLVVMEWDIDGTPGVDVQVTLDANAFGEYSNPYNGFTYKYPHNVAVTDVTPSKTVVGQGYSLNINVKVANLGNFNETFNVIVHHDKLADPTWEQRIIFWSLGDVFSEGYIDEIDIDLIAAAFGSTPGNPNWNSDADLNQDSIVNILDALICGHNQGLNIWAYFGLSPPPIGKQTITLTNDTSTTITFLWNTTGLAKGNYTLSAVADPVPGETYTPDNSLGDGTVYVGIPGDTNADGIVEMMDFYYTSLAFGSEPGDPNWNANTDVNDDSIVEMMDFFIISQHFGEHYP